MNIDLNEITTNLVPFRGGLHFLSASFAPLVALPESIEESDVGGGGAGAASRLKSLKLKYATSFAEQQSLKGSARQKRLAQVVLFCCRCFGYALEIVIEIDCYQGPVGF